MTNIAESLEERGLYRQAANRWCKLPSKIYNDTAENKYSTAER